MGSNGRPATALISTLRPGSTSPIFYDTKSDNELVQEVSTRIKNSNSIYDNEEFFMIIQKFNCRENSDKSKFSVFWSKSDRFIEMDTGNVSHKRRHAVAYE